MKEHPDVRDLVNLVFGQINDERVCERIKDHLCLKSCILCNRWVDKLRRTERRIKWSPEEMLVLESQFLSEASLLSVLPPVSSAVFRRYIQMEFFSEKEFYVEHEQLLGGLEINFVGCVEWDDSVMEFTFFAKGASYPFVNGFLPLCDLSAKRRYCKNTIYIPSQAMNRLEQTEFVINLYPIEIGELSAKDGDGTNLFWSALIADLSAYGNWFEFCQRLDKEGDCELAPWVKRIRRVISKL